MNNPDRKNDAEVQSLAWSNDGGITWTKYNGNPVLPNPGISDFRDPKVMWYAPHNKWVMTLAVKDRIMFFSSPNLKEWQKESEFGADAGAHGGVWECPDLVRLQYGDSSKWVLIVNINPGAPNGGSGTQYFVGDFDGKTFSSTHTDTRWLDFGPDNYAGVTWSNTGNRNVLMGWMSNWQYAQTVPTKAWRSATTLPRELGLQQVNGEYYVTAIPAAEVSALQQQTTAVSPGKDGSIILRQTDGFAIPCRIDLTFDAEKPMQFTLGNGSNELVGGFDAGQKLFYLDRSNAGESSFDSGFARRHSAPRIANGNTISMTLIIDVSSIELFADSGLSVMTQIYFPLAPWHTFTLHQKSAAPAMHYTPLRAALFSPSK